MKEKASRYSKTTLRRGETMPAATESRPLPASSPAPGKVGRSEQDWLLGGLPKAKR